MSEPGNGEQAAAAMYARANALWDEVGHEIFGGACGFSILNGPPVDRPALLIVGENPGFGATDREPHVERTWPSTSGILEARWPLARKLRLLFASADRDEVLADAIQTNFLFFKSRSIARESDYRWLNVQADLRERLERFSYNELDRFARIVRPDLVLVLGIHAFDRHCGPGRTLLLDRSGRRRLMAEGTAFGAPALGILHPTGARVAAADWSRVATELASRLPPPRA